MAGIVQPTLERAQQSCWVIRAAGSLKSGLALAPGSDPESASSFLRGLRLGGLVILFVARGGPRRGIGGGPIHHARLNKRERLAGRSVPSFATPYSWFDLTPRFRSVPSDVGVCAADATPGAAAPCAAALVIETDFVSKIGPRPRMFGIKTISSIVA